MDMAQTKLSVNINKIATLRNARGGNDPNLMDVAQKIQSFGAHGITIHPRPDERHIRRQDVFDLKPIVYTEFNIEGYPSEDFLTLINEVQPEQVTLVPDPPHVLTSNAGWKVKENKDLLKHVFKKISRGRISVFIDPQTASEEDFKWLYEAGAHRIELYTEAYAKAFDVGTNLTETLDSYKKTAELALKSGLEINAGHDLSQKNLGLFISTIPEISEVSIGHALISEALFEGLERTLRNYLKILKDC